MSDLLLVVPCFNEAHRLKVDDFLEAVRRVPRLHYLFVDDGSTDGTIRVIARICDALDGRGSALVLEANAGKAEAVRTGMASASRRPWFAVGYWDADLSTPLAELPQFVRRLREDPRTLAVLGSRVRLMGRSIDRRPMRHYGGRLYATLAAFTLGFPVYDTQCGAKLFRAQPEVLSVLTEPFCSNWAFDIEILARLRAKFGPALGERGVVVEHPLDTWTDVKGSKVGLSDLPVMIGELIRIRTRYPPRAGDAGPEVSPWAP